MLNGDTKIIAHVGYPTSTFKSPMIYNPWFDARGINAAVVPLGVKSEDFASAFPQICRFTNFHGALITMPHKISVVDFLDEVSTRGEGRGLLQAVRREGGRPDWRHVRRRGFYARRGAQWRLAQGPARARRRLGRGRRRRSRRLRPPQAPRGSPSTTSTPTR